MNLVNLEAVGLAYGPQVLLDGVSLGIAAGDRIGVVGRNGGGKTTLISIIAGGLSPDRGRVTHTRGLNIGYLAQRDDLDPAQAVWHVVLGDRPEHEWAGDARTREILSALIGDVDLDATAGTLSGGERRRVGLARLLIDDHDLIILDEPTNHLDIEAIDWLAGHLNMRKAAVLVVTHDRWFLDAVSTKTWEVVDGLVERYDGGYAAYILAKAERERIAAATEQRRRNLMRKELAWLRRGPPARTSKPKFRVETAQALIADEPPPRETVELVKFATARLGKTVYDVEDATVRAGETGGGSGGQGGGKSAVVLDHATWRLGPGDRVGLIGINGSGKTTVLRLLAGDVRPSAGRVVVGRTVRLAHLTQVLDDMDPAQRVLEAVEEVRGAVRVGRREFTASQLLERLGFRGEAQWKPVGELSGGERRRLQLLRLLMDDPNVLLLDEPTNDLDIETLTELEDILDGWPGTLVVVSHDRYFLERITDHCYALLGDGRLSLLPGGVDEYLSRRRASLEASTPGAQGIDAAGASRPSSREAAPPSRHPQREERELRKELARLERRLEKLTAREERLHAEMALLAVEQSTSHERLARLDAELKEVTADKDEAEIAWLETADRLEP